jgi:hypothetical protein
VIRGELQILQPIHWLAEVAAVLARLSPQTAADDVDMLAKVTGELSRYTTGRSRRDRGYDPKRPGTKSGVSGQSSSV